MQKYGRCPRFSIVETVETDWVWDEKWGKASGWGYSRAFGKCASGADAAYARRHFDLNEWKAECFIVARMNEAGESPLTDKALANILGAWGADGMAFIVDVYHKLNARGQARVAGLMRTSEYFESYRILVAMLGKKTLVRDAPAVGETQTPAGGGGAMRLCDIACNVLREKSETAGPDAAFPADRKAISVEIPVAERDKLIEAAQDWWEANQDGIHDKSRSYVVELVGRTVPARDKPKSFKFDLEVQ